MKRHIAWRRSICAAVGLLLSVNIALAAVLEDGTGARASTQNLIPEAGSSRVGWSSPPWDKYLSQSSNAAAAQAVYPIQDTTQVEVSVYSRYGSFASVLDGDYVRGHWGEGAYRLQYSTRTGRVYLDGLEMVYDLQAPAQYSFQPAQQPDRLVDYGLNLYWSADGEDYTRAETWMADCQAEDGAHYYETYQGEIDPQARFLKLVLYDHHTLPVAGREDSYRYTATGDLAIARVEVDGSFRSQASTPSPDSSSSQERPQVPEQGSSSLPPQSSSSLPQSGGSPFQETPGSSPQPGEEILETAPDGAALTPAFREQELPQSSSQSPPPKDGASSPSSSGGKSGAKKSGKATGESEAIQGMGQLHGEEEVAAAQAPQIIRPRSLAGEEEGFLDRLNTPEGSAVLFFSLACLLLAAKILAKV